MQHLKTRGLTHELRPLIARVSRSYAMGRIGTADHEYLLSRLKEVEARIIKMRETNNDGEEVG